MELDREENVNILQKFLNFHIQQISYIFTEWGKRNFTK